MKLDKLTSMVQIADIDLKERPSIEQWASWEAANNLILPSEFKEILNYYGTGVFGDFLYLWNPFSDHPNYDMAIRVTETIHNIQEVESWIWRDRTYGRSLFPEPDGIMPFASTNHDYTLFWKMDGNPDSWKIIIENFKMDAEFSVEDSLIDILCRLLSLPERDSDPMFWNLASDNVFIPLP